MESAIMFIFLFCPVLGCLLSFIMLSYSLPRCAALSYYVCFWGSWFCSPAINQTSRSQSKRLVFICLTLQTGKYHWAGFASSISAANILDQLELKTSCEGRELWKLSAVFVHLCGQPATLDNYSSPARTFDYALRK